MITSKRFEKLKTKPIFSDSFFVEWPEGGLIAMKSPYDPKPSLIVEDGIVLEMDGKRNEEFDSIEKFIATHSIHIENSKDAMSRTSEEIARMILDINISREEILEITTAITPAKMLEVVNCLNAVEIMMSQMKMRVRKTPVNQAHATNVLDHPALLAADAAEAALRGFAEIETTCAVSRYAPLNALSILVGGLSARPGVLTQCAMEEALELKLGLLGLTSYAETLSLYGTEKAMDDGDDTIWSKAFLSSIYASRGIKMRCTSGTGSEVLMGHSKNFSMLYLEILCVYMAKGAGIQGIQNGSISCIGITTSVPDGFLAIAAENLVVSLLDLELASGNDQTFTHSDMRRTAKLLMQMLPGTDLITSGYSAMPNFDDVFAGSNTDCDDYDDYYMIQRDMQVDGGIVPIRESEAIACRNRGAKALQDVFQELGLPPITDEEVEEATYAYSNEEMPPRNMPADLSAAQEFMSKKCTVIDVIKALHHCGHIKTADNFLGMVRERIAGDYLQVAAVFNDNGKLIGGLNDRNDYLGPGSGYRLKGERWEQIKQKFNAYIPQNILEEQGKEDYVNLSKGIEEGDTPEPGEVDIIIGVSPAFGNKRSGKEIGRTHLQILETISNAVVKEGCQCSIIKIYHTYDLADIAALSAMYSRKGVGIGIQSNGRACIYLGREKQGGEIKAFYNIPFTEFEHYSRVGKRAAAYANGQELSSWEENHFRGLTNYQMQMLRLGSEEKQYLNKNRQPSTLVIDNE